MQRRLLRRFLNWLHRNSRELIMPMQDEHGGGMRNVRDDEFNDLIDEFLQQRNERQRSLDTALTLLREMPLMLHHPDDRGPCRCSQCQLRTKVAAFLKRQPK